MLHPHPHPQAPRAALRENRLAPRVPCSVPLRIQRGDDAFDGTIENLSTSGAAVELGRPVQVGDEIELDFVLDPGQKPVRCRALVARTVCSSDWLYGLRFAGVKPVDRKRLAAFVRGRLPESTPRAHWRADLGEAELVGPGQAPTVLRWPPALPALFAEIAERLANCQEVFVPGDCDALVEGQGVHLELHAPFSHAVFRLLCEVVWVERSVDGALQPGASLRLSALSPIDRRLLSAASCHPNDLEVA